ncbi:MAG: phosphotransferase [Gammaproteobacteria bacterium]|nr:phosphotransferase [Gammaproteobacteria bacterium]
MPELNLPRVLPTKNGDFITIINGFAIRMLTFLEGEILGQGNHSPSMYNSIGHFMGCFSKAMQDYSHPDANRADDLWNLDNIMVCRQYLSDVKNADDRKRIEHFFQHYINDTLPKLPSLRRAIIHGDANEQNLLVGAESSNEITGLIDFGDLQLSTLVNEIAITIAYALLGEDDIEMASREILQGYTREFPLDATELEVLPNLIAIRLTQSILMSSHRAKLFPDNEYITISQKPARALLKKLYDEPFTLCGQLEQ